MATMPVDLFSGEGTQCPEDASGGDLAASLDGRFVFLHVYSDIGSTSLYVLDTFRGCLQRVDPRSTLSSRREHYFTFVLGRDELACVVLVLVGENVRLAVFKTSLRKLSEESAKYSLELSPGRLVGQAVFCDHQRLIACQWGSEIFVILDDGAEDGVWIHRFLTEKMSLVSRRIRPTDRGKNNLKDAIAFDGKLFILEGPRQTFNPIDQWFNPSRILVVDFEHDFQVSWKATKPDLIHNLPSGTDFGMDLSGRAMWLFADDKWRTTDTGSLWRLDLESLQWARMEFRVGHKIRDPLVHCLPNGRVFLFGSCPEFPVVGSSSDVGSCCTPAHLYAFTLDVERLDSLALTCLRKHFPGISDWTPRSLLLSS